MKKYTRQSYPRVLSIDPCQKGFGFVVLEGEQRLIDWGVAHLSSTSEHEFLVRIDRLVERYGPRLILTEDVPASRQRTRAQRRVKALGMYARDERIGFLSVRRGDIRQAFSGIGKTKDQIAAVLAGEFPELTPKLPPPRKPWMAEDERMSIFDALAFVVALPEAQHRQAGTDSLAATR